MLGGEEVASKFDFDRRGIMQYSIAIIYGYEKDLSALRSFNESLIEKNNPEAIERKIMGLENGNNGYERNPSAARVFNESLVEKGDPEAAKRKIWGLAKGQDGYKKDPLAAKEFIESLVIDNNSVTRGIGKYLKAFALKYGISELGYEKNHEKAIEFIKQNYVPY